MWHKSKLKSFHFWSDLRPSFVINKLGTLLVALVDCAFIINVAVFEMDSKALFILYCY